MLSASFCAVALAALTVVEPSPWGDVSVVTPEIADRAFPITAFSNDVNAAMAACAASGGGRVVVPNGTWLSKGPVRFRSNCALELAEGAVLEFSDDPKDYLPAVHTTWEGSECLNYSPLIYAYGCTNVAIVGKGELRPRLSGWQSWRGRSSAHQAMTAQLYHWMSTNAPVSVRDVTRREGNFRPHLIQFNRSDRILLKDFRINGSPFWTTHLYLSRNVLMEGVRSYAHGHNNDGVDIEMTQNVIVRNCRFDQGDDGVVLKAGRNQDGWRLATPTKNVVIRDCELVDGHGLLVIGSEMAGGVENVYMKNCRATGKGVHRMMYLKTNERRGGFMRRIVMEDCTAKDIRNGAFEIATDVLYQWAKFPTYEVKLTEIDDIVMKNCRVGSAKAVYDIRGDARRPIGRVTLENVAVESVRGESAAKNVASLVVRSERTAKTVPLFLTGGQSNTDGRLRADTLPDYLQFPNSNALVSAHSPYEAMRLGVFLPFAPASKARGQPGMWAYDAVVYHHLAKAIGTFYVAKTSFGGTSIDPAVNCSPSRIGIEGAVWHPEIGRGYHWSADPSFLAKTVIAGQPFEVNGTNCVGQSLFKAWMANVDAAIDAIRARGETPDVKAIIWHQGESDRLKVSRAYEKNIKTLIAAIRAHVVEKTGDSRYLALPFVCGTVPRASKGYNGRIAEALMKMNGVDHVYVIDNADLTLQRDRLHFDAPAAELFGNRLYRRLVDEGIVKEGD